MTLVQLLRRFDFTVLRNKSATDNAQVPAQGTFQFFRQGATVRTTTTLLPTDPPVERDIVVDDIGQLAEGDDIAIGFNGPLYTVTGLIGRTKVRILYTGTSSQQVTAGTRLVGPSVAAFRDARGSVPLQAPYQSDATTGRFGAYRDASRFDFILTTGGMPLRSWIDYEGGPAAAASGWLSARDFPSLESAVNAATEGQQTTIVLEPETYLYGSALVLPTTKQIRLLGAGIGQTTLTCTDPDQPTVDIRGSRCGLEGLTVRGPGVVGTGPGVRIGRLAAEMPTPPDVIRYITLRDVHIVDTPGWGLDIQGTDAAGADPIHSLSIFGRFSGVTVSGNRSGGALRVGRGCTTQNLVSCEFLSFAGQAARLYFADGCSFLQCTFEGQPYTGSGTPLPFVEVVDSRAPVFVGCWFEDDPLPPPPPDEQKGWFMKASGARTEGLVMTGCVFARPTGYRTAAVCLAGCSGATLTGMSTYAPNDAYGTQQRDDVVLERVFRAGPIENPESYDYPSLVLDGGSAAVAPAAVPQDETLQRPITVRLHDGLVDQVFESHLDASSRRFGRRASARLPWLPDTVIQYLRSHNAHPPGTIIFNQAMARLEYFDGTQWWHVPATAIQP